MAKEEKSKIILERIYNVPLRKEWLKVPMHKRAKKAVKALRQFLAKHMKAADIKNVKIGRWANEDLWFRGTKNPPHHIKVKAEKDEKGIVRTELIELTKRAQIIEEKEKKSREEIEKKPKKEEKKEEVKEEKESKEETKAEGEVKKEEKEVMKETPIKSTPDHEHKSTPGHEPKHPHRVALQK